MNTLLRKLSMSIFPSHGHNNHHNHDHIHILHNGHHIHIHGHIHSLHSHHVHNLHKDIRPQLLAQLQQISCHSDVHHNGFCNHIHDRKGHILRIHGHIHSLHIPDHVHILHTGTRPQAQPWPQAQQQLPQSREQKQRTSLLDVSSTT